MSTFSSANITDGNLVLKGRTHRIKIKYSMHQYSIRLHNLGNWLMQLFSPPELRCEFQEAYVCILIHTRHIIKPKQ